MRRLLKKTGTWLGISFPIDTEFFTASRILLHYPKSPPAKPGGLRLAHWKEEVISSGAEYIPIWRQGISLYSDMMGNCLWNGLLQSKVKRLKEMVPFWQFRKAVIFFDCYPIKTLRPVNLFTGIQNFVFSFLCKFWWSLRHCIPPLFFILTPCKYNRR